METTVDRRRGLIGVVLVALVISTWTLAFFGAPTDANQGEVYRIIFLHVPSAFTAFFAALILFVVSILGLARRSEEALRWGKAAAEVGLLFTILTLATGSIWGKPTWGTWWTWDARLTTTFILALLYVGYLLLHGALQPGNGRLKACAVLGILIFIDVPIIYKSVSWWRTLHQPPSILRAGGSSMDPDILQTLLICSVALLLFAIWVINERRRNLALADELEEATYAQMRG